MTLRVDIKHDLLVLSGLSILTVLNTRFLQSPALYIVLGLPYIMLFPGYSLVAALFPGQDDLSWLERLGLSLILSVSIVAITGLVLNYSWWGVTLVPFLILLTSLILLACIVAHWRRQRLDPVERFMLRIRVKINYQGKLDRLDNFLLLLLMISVGAAIVGVILLWVMPGPPEPFTEFYVLGLDQRLGGYPRLITVNESVILILKVVNHEHADVQYHIERKIDEDTEQIARLRLSHEGTWKQFYTFTLTESGENQVAFLLYKGDDDEPYRSLHLWITVKEKSFTQ